MHYVFFKFALFSLRPRGLTSRTSPSFLLASSTWSCWVSTHRAHLPSYWVIDGKNPRAWEAESISQLGQRSSGLWDTPGLFPSMSEYSILKWHRQLPPFISYICLLLIYIQYVFFLLFWFLGGIYSIFYRKYKISRDKNSNDHYYLYLLEASMRPDTSLVSIMTVNNEIGVLQPVHEIGKLCRSRKVTMAVLGSAE